MKKTALLLSILLFPTAASAMDPLPPVAFPIGQAASFTLQTTLYQAGLAHYHNGDYEQAYQTFTQFVAFDPTNSAAYARLGRSAAMTERWEEAHPHLAKALELNPNNAEAYGALGHLTAPEDPEKALTYYEKALQLAPDNPRYLVDLAYFHLYMQGDLPKALEAIVAALHLQPDLISGHTALAHCYMASLNLEQAEKAFAKAIAINPGRGYNYPGDLRNAYQERSYFFDATGRNADGLANQNEFIRRFPGYAPAYVIRGYFRINLGQVDAGIADELKALQLEPDNPLAYLNLAYGYLEKKQYDKSIEASNRAIALDPWDGINYNNRAIAYFEKGLYDQARQDLAQAREYDGIQYDGQLYLGRLALLDGDYPAAQSAIEKAIKLKADYGLAYLYLGDVLKLQGQTAASRTAYQKALDLGIAEAQSRLAQ